MNYFLSNKVRLCLPGFGSSGGFPVLCAVVATAFLGATALRAAESPHAAIKPGNDVKITAVQTDPGSWRRNPFLQQSGKRPEPPVPGTPPGRYTARIDGYDTPPPLLRLQGIMQVEAASYALVNGRVYKVGDTLAEGVVVKEIGRYHMVIQNKGALQSYNIFQGKLK